MGCGGSRAITSSKQADDGLGFGGAAGVAVDGALLVAGGAVLFLRGDGG